MNFQILLPYGKYNLEDSRASENNCREAQQYSDIPDMINNNNNNNTNNNNWFRNYFHEKKIPSGSQTKIDLKQATHQTDGRLDKI